MANLKNLYSKLRKAVVEKIAQRREENLDDFIDLYHSMADKVTPEARNKMAEIINVSLKQKEKLSGVEPELRDKFRRLVLPLLVGGAAVAGTSDEAEASLAPGIRKLYKTLAETSQKTLFHRAKFPEELVERGMQKGLGEHEAHKPLGLYWTDVVKNIPGHLSGDWTPAKQNLKSLKMYLQPSEEKGSRVIRGVVKPNTKIYSISESDLSTEFNKFIDANRPSGMPLFVAYNDPKIKQQWTEYLSTLGDILHIKNADYQKGVNEFIQLKPEAIDMFHEGKARLGSKFIKLTPKEKVETFKQFSPKEDYASLNARMENLQSVGQTFSDEHKAIFTKWLDKAKFGVGAGAALGSVFAGETEEAEAMPIGKLKPAKLASEAMKKATRSDAFDRLLGTTIDYDLGQGKQPFTVVDVLKQPQGNQRWVIFEDTNGERFQLPMTKDYLNVFSGAQGTKDYLEQLMYKGSTEKKIQAEKSQIIREERRESTGITKKELQKWNTMQAGKAAEISPQMVNDYVYFRGEGVDYDTYIPRAYADILEKTGKGRITGQGPNPKNILKR